MNNNQFLDDIQNEIIDAADKVFEDEDLIAEDINEEDEESEKARAEEFFKEAECPKCGKDPCECPVDEAEKKDDAEKKEEDISEGDKDEDAEKDPVDESDAEADDDKELAESLKEYRKNNAHLFND